MNFALSTFVIIFLLFPGLIFRRFYFTEEFSKQYVKNNYLEQFFASLLPSLVFHLGWYYFIMVFGYRVDLKIFGYIFTQDKINLVFSNFEKYSTQIFIYHITIFVFSAIAGFSAKSLIRKLKLDRKQKLLRYQNSWHYLFKGEFFDFPKAAFDLFEDKVHDIELFFVDILTVVAENTILYQGVLVDYELASNGGLNYIVLKDTRRKFINRDKTDSPAEDEYYHIPGHIMIIPYNNIQNMNISFYKLREVTEEENPDQNKKKYEIILVE